MKVLVGTACVAILAAVGYYFWTEYQRAQVLREAEQRAQYRRDCLASLAAITEEGNQDKVALCLMYGGLSQADLDAKTGP